MRRLAVLLVVAGCCAVASRSPLKVNATASRLALVAEGAPVELASVAFESSVAHGLATTRLELTFRNDRDRVLEGELTVPLPEGASLCSFALEVGGEMREATLVERERARVA